MKFTAVTIQGMIAVAKWNKNSIGMAYAEKKVPDLPGPLEPYTGHARRRFKEKKIKDVFMLHDKRSLTHDETPITCCTDQFDIEPCDTPGECYSEASEYACSALTSAGFYIKTDNGCYWIGACFFSSDCSGSSFLATEPTCKCHGGAGFVGLSSLCTDLSTSVAECSGDPHFTTWKKKEQFDFHGEGDVIAIKQSSFHKFLGIDLHLRLTKMLRKFSFIEEAVLKIGQDKFWVHSLGDFSVNGVQGSMVNTTKASFAGFQFSHWHAQHDYFHLFSFKFGETGAKIEFKAFENMLFITADGGTSGVFADSLGMLGDGKTGSMLGRDGTTIINDPNEFGVEWQVRDTDNKLFRVLRAPQWPEKIIFPTEDNIPLLRNIHDEAAKTTVPSDVAEQACAHLNQDKKSNCVFDVIATGNLEIANMKKIEDVVVADMITATSIN